jgi:hypothetical protein
MLFVRCFVAVSAKTAAEWQLVIRQKKEKRSCKKKQPGRIGFRLIAALQYLVV